MPLTTTPPPALAAMFKPGHTLTPSKGKALIVFGDELDLIGLGCLLGKPSSKPTGGIPCYPRWLHCVGSVLYIELTQQEAEWAKPYLAPAPALSVLVATD